MKEVLVDILVGILVMLIVVLITTILYTSPLLADILGFGCVIGFVIFLAWLLGSLIRFTRKYHA